MKDIRLDEMESFRFLCVRIHIVSLSLHIVEKNAHKLSGRRKKTFSNSEKGRRAFSCFISKSRKPEGEKKEELSNKNVGCSSSRHKTAETQACGGEPNSRGKKVGQQACRTMKLSLQICVTSAKKADRKRRPAELAKR